MNFILQINELKKYFGNVKAVDGLSFKISKGEIYGLLGPNGAGKTTTIKCILGLLEPTNGKILVFDKDPIEDDIYIKNKIGYVSEEPLIYKSLTPKELFDFIASVRKLNKEKTESIISELLISLEANEYINKPIAVLSKGNKQKMQIISALMHNPEFLILDEPLSGLDVRSNKIVKNIIKMHAENGGSVMLSTHLLEIAEGLCTRIGIINKGKMIAEGTLEELKNLAQEAGAASLEDVFLKLTKEDQSVQIILQKLRETLK